MRIYALLPLKSRHLGCGMPNKSRCLRSGLLLARILPSVSICIIGLTEGCYV